MPIKNIIFDLGGVFIDIHFDRTQSAFEHLGFANYGSQFNLQYYAPLFQQLETGHISPSQFFDGLRQMSGQPLTNEQITGAWNAMLGAFRPAALQLLAELRSNYRLLLFSNTNSIHYDAFTAEYGKSFGLPHFDSLFAPAYYSHTLGLRKPHPESFTAILQKEGLSASETLFIDDTTANLEGATAAGLTTLALPPGTYLEDVLPPFLRVAG
ncbi:MAG: HAD family phosphatase [Bacteroidetes bacterium]|nr:MAG: HAD family phosphatase [Bacteroidota bacterium]